MDSGILTHEQLKTYYGRTLQHSEDLATNACCCAPPPTAIRDILQELDHEIIERFYGCGSPIPPLLDGCKVLDLGCGTGRDVYILSKLVGPAGRVIGIDMTDAQIEVGIRHIESMTERFGYDAPNVEFRKGYIEDLAAAGIEDHSIDLVVSNCVINLSPHKRSVFREIFRVLKPGGEVYFSDVFSTRRIPAALLEDPVLYGECLSGALYDEDFRRMLAGFGCPDVRCAESSRITIDNPEVEARIGMIGFFSRTLRAFKVDGLEDRSEDYGQVATYRGTIPDHPHEFALSGNDVFTTGKPVRVCGNTAAMIEGSRYGAHFAVTGDRSIHFGPFDCCCAAPASLSVASPASAESGGGSCC